MHEINLSSEVLDIARRRRGGQQRAYEAVDPKRTAHLIVDLQNGFMAEGAAVEVPIAREIVPNVNAISRALRAAGGLNVFIHYTMRDEALETWSSWYSHFHDAVSRNEMKEAFTPGSDGWALWPALDVAPEDLRIEKARFSAFIPGTCDLHTTLQQRGIDTLIITGTVTNCCCESTARDAMQMNYKVIFAADGNAAMTDAAHNATLNSLASVYADVLTTDEIVGLFG
jgi:ureidoacrylate peracid hydrolase